ncbi:hypothetical protein DL96DRAFT_1579244, partial [Flagelloscypha sp. PMI_526]
MPVFPTRRFTGPERIPKWFDNDISAHHLVFTIPVFFVHLKRKVATTEYSGPATLKTLSHQTREAQSQLIHVEQLIKTLKEFITIRVKVAPIMNLPREIFLSIFEFFGPTNDIAMPKAIPALTLGQICHDFRALALGTPHLWSSITIDAPQLDRFKLEQQMPPIVKSMTKRLQICAEHLLVDFHDATTPFFNYLATLIPCLRLINWISAQPNLSQITFPHLRSYSEREDYQGIPNLSFLQGAPCLEQLHVFSLPEDFRLVTVIQSKRMESLTGRMSLHRLELSHAWSFNPTSIARLSFPSLRSLTITGRYSFTQDGSIPIEWFSRICCPKLETLSLACAYFAASATCAFQELLEMTFRQLSLSSCSFTDSQFESFLTSVPSITSFHCDTSDGHKHYLTTSLQSIKLYTKDSIYRSE